jgi:hypothetical protein
MKAFSMKQTQNYKTTSPYMLPYVSPLYTDYITIVPS